MEVKDKKLSFFDFLNSINGGSKGPDLLATVRNLPDGGARPDSPEKQYVPFMVNRGLSYFQDTVLFANEMNRHYRLPALMQYDFLRMAIRPRKRFSKWIKASEQEHIELISKAYNYSQPKAREALKLLSDDQIADIEKLYDTGGLSK